MAGRFFRGAREWASRVRTEHAEDLRYTRQLLQFVGMVWVVDQHVIHLSMVRVAWRRGTAPAPEVLWGARYAEGPLLLPRGAAPCVAA